MNQLEVSIETDKKKLSVLMRNPISSIIVQFFSFIFFCLSHFLLEGKSHLTMKKKQLLDRQQKQFLKQYFQVSTK